MALVAVFALLVGCAQSPSPPTSASLPSTSTPSTPPGSTMPTPATFSTTPTTSTPVLTPTPPPTGGAPSCASDPDVVCPSPFTDATLLDHVAPIGDPGGGTMSRSYVAVRGDVVNHSWPMVPVIAPANMTLTGVVHAHKEYGRDEYRLEFQVTCEVRLWFDHVAIVRDDIAALWIGPPTNATNVIAPASLAIHAGEKLGETNGTFVAGTWDFAVFNSAHPAAHANASRWLSDHDTIAECPYTHFAPAIRATYFALLVAKDGSHTTDCRSTSRDINGTLAGGWFQGESNDQHPPWLEVATDGPTLVELRIIGQDGSLFNLREYHPSQLPDNVHAGGAACWSDGQNYAWMTLVDDATMRLARGPGACPASEPAGGAAWQR